MDLRPKIAAEIVDEILKELGWKGQPNTPGEEVRKRWIDLAVSKMVSHSLDVYVCSEDLAIVQQYRDKYPQLNRLIELVQTEALRRWPEATFTFEVFSDPESSHICFEGQHLVLKIMTGLPFVLKEGEPSRLIETARIGGQRRPGWTSPVATAPTRIL